MTAFEPVLVACNAYKNKQVYASSCVGSSSATSTQASAVILEQVSSQVTYNAMSCSISLYHCIVHSPTKNFMRPVLWKELHGNVLHCCMLCPPARHFTERLCLYIGLVFHNRLWAVVVYVKDNINPTTLSTNMQYYGKDRLPVVQMFCCCRSSFCTKHIPSMTQVDGVGITSARDTFSSSSLVNAVLFVFRRDPSAFASAHGSGHSGHRSCSHFCSQLPESSG